MYLNKVIIVGNLTKDVELKAIPNGTKVANFGVATNRNWKDKEGNKKEEVEFHNVVVFGKQAETIAQYMKKGNQILVEGRLQTRSWDADGKKMYRTEIMLENFQFGNKPQEKSTLNDEERERIIETKKAYGMGEDEAEETQDDEISPESIPF